MSHKFQINLRGIIDLLSHHLYSGPQVYVRELLQNGTDAIRARCEFEPGHQGEIAIEVIQGKTPTLAFVDNGIGLTEDEIHRFLATIGATSKRGEQWSRPGDFLGQFGIGLLSCFVVSDEIVVITRSVRPNSKTIEWRGRPDGTYGVRELDRDVAPGTQVYLTCRKGSEEYFQPERVAELAAHYGGLLPYPVRVQSGKGTQVVNAEGAPWDREYESPEERRAALLEYGRKTFDIDFFDCIPLHSRVGGVGGVAFVLPFSPSLATRRTHRVYLKHMLLSENAENLLPEWAFFVKCVVNANDLRPTASRESFYEDDTLQATQEALGECLREYLVRLARTDAKRLQKLIALHYLSIKALAVQDDDFFRLFIDWLPFETSMGDMTFGEYRRQHPVVRYVPDLDQFRQISRVAAAQSLCVLNGAYTYNLELLEKFRHVFPDAAVEVVEPASLTQTFEDLSLDEQEKAFALVQTADLVLQPFKCSASVKKFFPKEVPALYTTSPDAGFLRSVEQSKEIADPFWSSVLDNLSGNRAAEGYAQLCFNFNNPLIRKIAPLKNRAVLGRSIQMLYVQSLLLGHHPLNAKEMKLLNEGLLGLIEWGIDAQEKGGDVSGERIEELLDEAYGLPPGPSQIALLEEAARLADTHGFEEQGFEIREELIHSCTFSGYPEKSLVAFAWCLAQCDRDPEQFFIDDILWKYKWIVGSLSGFPQIAREQIDSMIVDMKRRYQQAGAGFRPVYRLQCDLALDMGDFEAAREHQQHWELAQRDWLTDCAACELDAAVHYHLLAGETERGVEEAEPILSGRLRCNEVPHHTLARLLVPLLQLGRREEAAECHQRGYRLIVGRREFIAYVASHLTYLALAGKNSRGVALLERHLPLAMDMNHLSRRFAFYLATALLLERLVAKGKTTLPLRLPPRFKPVDDGGNQELPALLAWVNGELQELAERFDRRNGNDYHRRQIAENRELKKWA